uniref:acrosomal protein SP-10-like n=1 Tax=Urocitellus parryii TaxID=9999 RepID=UPI000E55B7F1|nr:acrosomal protein SP-10-like [Urocitellus parryii]
MDKFLLLLLMLGPLPVVFFQGVVQRVKVAGEQTKDDDLTVQGTQALMCTVCSSFKDGRCLKGKGNCTLNSVSACRTMNIFIFSETDGWLHDHTELDCQNFCFPSHMYYEQVKVSSYCCKNQDFCNRYQGSL